MGFNTDYEESEVLDFSLTELEQESNEGFFETDGGNDNELFLTDFDATITDFDKIQPKNSEPDLFASVAPSVNFKSLNQTSAEVVVSFGDTAIAWIMSDLVAKTGDIEKYKASKEERKELSEAVFRLLPDNKPIMSPKMQLIAVIAKVYGAKINSAMKDRKITELELELKEQKRQIADLKRKADIKRTRNSMLRDQAKTDEYLQSKKVKVGSEIETESEIEIDEQTDISD